MGEFFNRGYFVGRQAVPKLKTVIILCGFALYILEVEQDKNRKMCTHSKVWNELLYCTFITYPPLVGETSWFCLFEFSYLGVTSRDLSVPFWRT